MKYGIRQGTDMEKDRTLPQKRRVDRKRVDIREGVSPESRRRMIEESAYYRSQRRASGDGGDHVEDWLQAEAEIDSMLNAS
ncbi:MAG TPA: DUF2934 domain-containing protein [Burkholderiales bacterium]|nr:DUF2934 domain-containing protein [Burkholderiales bacterium]